MPQPLRLLVLALLFLQLAAPAAAQEIVDSGFAGVETPAHDHMPDEMQARIQAQIEANVARLRAEGVLTPPDPRSVSFGWPLREAEGYWGPGYHGVSNFVDHDAAFPNALQDYTCGTRTYDLPNGYNHSGTDYFTWPFAWYLMDHDLVKVVAIADGTIVLRHDGAFDRNCSFSGTGQWNAVYVAHADGSVAWYGHLKKDSVTPKGVGEAVQAGEYLGVIGSSGFSTGPHLHLEIRAADGTTRDPYEGECNPTGASLWAEQRPYYDSAINAVLTHHAPPQFPTCPQQEVLNLRDAFNVGDTAYGAVYLRDQRQGQVGQVRLRRPNGSLALNQSFQLTNVPHYTASYWYWAINVSTATPQGVWQWEFTFGGETHARTFTVGQTTSAEDGAPRAFRVGDPFPNPAASGATLPLRLDRAEHVRATVYDLLGRPVAVVHDAPLAAGTEHRIAVDGLPSGRYVVVVRGESFAERRALTVMR